ncbi:uncharacterized protein LOC130644435 isoform X2 [Hydractinia symbiolongicarpus]|uniref:uncharacterized protein LOC130644435 isoform X2 n=1 Tax=Hydractinia symbiolongicarpus TaxID=13093 RepID=UPI00254F1D8F|nr:uncharacterized protein LOC130644435 isoform X2 [Hydractinia symbiolongicarpus]
MASVKDIKCLQNFLELSMAEFQFFLSQRGLPTSGSHRTLAVRALIAHEQKVEVKATAEHTICFCVTCKKTFDSDEELTWNVWKEMEKDAA